MLKQWLKTIIGIQSNTCAYIKTCYRNKKKGIANAAPLLTPLTTPNPIPPILIALILQFKFKF